MNDPLQRPLALPCGAVLPNRIMKAAMTEGLADVHGRATPRLVRLYRRWAGGGAGLLVTGNVMIDHRFLERPGNLVVDDNGGLAALRELAAAGTAGDTHLWAQISHPGRQCSRIVSGRPLAPSAVQLRILFNFARPEAMTEAQIEQAVEGYARVAATLRDTGFTGVQIHGAHGYLISQFLSPVTNRRDDRWGGSLANRARFLLRTVREVRAAVGEQFPVGVKLNSADFQKGGFTLEESREVARWLGDEGIDLLEISGGTYEQLRLLGYGGRSASADEPLRESTRRREAYFLEYARAIREATAIPLAVTGGFRSAAFMREAVADGSLDVIGLARPLVVEPDLPRRLFAAAEGEARRDEEDLRLGPGVFGPNSPLFAFKALNAQGGVAWYYRQIIRLAEGREPDVSLRMLPALAAHFRDEYRLGFARRRALAHGARPAERS